MKKFYIIFLVLCAFALQAQEIPLAQEVSNERTWSIKFNAIQLIDGFAFPVVMLGTEKKINRWFSLNAEAGYQFYNIRRDPEIIVYKQRGFKANIEARTYIISMFNPNASRKARGLFCGVQLFYRQNQFTTDYSYYRQDNPDEKIVDIFGVRKTAYGLNICVGYQKATRHFLFEPYIAFGPMYRDIKNSGRQIYNDDDALEESFSEYNFPSDKSEDTVHTGNFTAGIRFGYIF